MATVQRKSERKVHFVVLITVAITIEYPRTLFIKIFQNEGRKTEKKHSSEFQNAMDAIENPLSLCAAH